MIITITETDNNKASSFDLSKLLFINLNYKLIALHFENKIESINLGFADENEAKKCYDDIMKRWEKKTT